MLSLTRRACLPALNSIRLSSNMRPAVSEQLELTFQKVNKLWDDRHGPDVRLCQAGKESVRALSNEEGRLANFWLDAAVRNPVMLGPAVRVTSLREWERTLSEGQFKAPRKFATRFLTNCDAELLNS